MPYPDAIPRPSQTPNFNKAYQNNPAQPPHPLFMLQNNEILRRDTTVVKPENQVITMTHTYSTGNGTYGNWNN